MRILQVIPVFSDPFGGPVTVVRSISKELAKRHEVTVYTTSALNQKHDFKGSLVEVETDGYHVAYFPRIFRSIGFNVSLAMERALKKTLSEYNVIHLHSWRHFQDIIIHHYAKRYNVPYLLQAHGSLPRIMAKQRLKWIYDMSFGYRLLEDAAKVIALSRVEVEQYRRMGVPKEKIAIIINGIDLSEYADLPPKGCFRKKFSIKEEKIVLYLGRIHRVKGIDFLIKSFAYLVKNGMENVKLVIAGPDDGYLYEAKSLASLLGVSGKVLFTGILSKEDKINSYVDSTLCVYLSPYEPFGLVPLEAAATYTPAIVIRRTPMAKIIQKGNFGFSVEYNDIESLVKSMKSILIEDELANELGKNGQKFVIENFSIEKMTKKLEKLYESLL